MSRNLDGLDTLRFVQRYADEVKRRGRRLTDDEQDALLTEKETPCLTPKN